VGIAIASAVAVLAIRSVRPDIGLWQTIELILGWVVGFPLGILVVLALSPCWLIWIGMGCDLSTASETNSCVQAMLVVLFMLSYVVMGLVGGLNVENVLRPSERSLSKLALAMLVIVFLACYGTFSLSPGEDLGEMLELSSTLTPWALAAIALEGVAISAFLVATLARIQEFRSADPDRADGPRDVLMATKSPTHKRSPGAAAALQARHHGDEEPQRISSQRIMCPVCGHDNSVRRSTCKVCRARLSEASTGKQGLGADTQEPLTYSTESVTAAEERQIYFEAEHRTTYYRWRFGYCRLEEPGGDIAVFGEKPDCLTITIPVGDIDVCELVERPNTRYFSRMLGEGARGKRWWLRGYDATGCIMVPGLLLAVMVPVADAVIARASSVAAVKLTESAHGATGRGCVLHLRSERDGRSGRAETMAMAHRIVAFLLRHGHSGPLPDLPNLQ